MMMNPGRLVAAGALLWFCVGTAAARELWVSPAGSDANPGKAAQPLATLTAARDAARQMKGEEVTIWLKGGTYRVASTFKLGREDSGAEGSAIVYRAAPGEEARVSGGQLLDASHFKPVTDPPLVSRLPAEARGHVVQLDLAAEGVKNLGKMEPRGFGQPMRPVQPEVIFNDRPMQLARWPNSDLAKYGKVIDPGSAPRLRLPDLLPSERKDEPDRGGRFVYTDERPARWVTADDAWLFGFWHYGWADDTIKIARIDPEKHEIVLATPAFYGVEPNNRFYAINLLEELDAPGEYYIDRAKGTLYFWPPAPLEGSRVVLTQLREPLVAVEGASHVTFRDLIFEDCCGPAVEIAGGNGNRMIGCTVRNVGNCGISMGDGALSERPWTGADRDGGRGHGISNCRIAHTGAEGIVLSGGNRKTLTAGGLFVRNSEIYDVGRWYRQNRPAIAMYGVGNSATNNFIHDCVHCAIMFWGKDMVIEKNDIARCVTDSDDAGAIYTGRNPSARGTRIRHNLFRDIGPETVGSTGVFSIYFDDTSSGQIVEENIFYRSRKGTRINATVFINGGCDNVIQDNVLIDCPVAVVTHAWPAAEWMQFVNGHVGVQKLRQEVDITKPPYSTRYPELARVYDASPTVTRTNTDRNNRSLPADDRIRAAMGDISPSERAAALASIPALRDLARNMGVTGQEAGE